MTKHAVIVEGLVRRFGTTTALHEVDLEVDEGTIVALIGPNGAGKTTLVRILSTLLRPSSGRASVAGFDVVSQPAEVRKRIGLAGQNVAIDQDLTGRENLILFGRLLRLSRGDAHLRADDLLSEFELTDAARRPLHTYSGGMRRRLDLAASLIARPEILFLDEPTEGLDPASRIVLWQVIRRYAERGTTVFLTTHYLEEADELADRIVLIDRGQITAQGTAVELKRRVGGRGLVVTLIGPAERERAERALGIMAAEGSPGADPNLLYIPVDGGAAIIDVMKRLGESGAGVSDVRIDAPSLDDVFLAMTGDLVSGDEEAVDEASPSRRGGARRRRRVG